jgi:hypothetical protein
MPSKGIIDAIYFRLHTTFLKNERDLAAMFLGMLEDEKPEAVQAEIGPIHYKRLLHMKEEVHNGTFRRFRSGGEAMPEMNGILMERSRDEAAFHRLIMAKEGRRKLFDALGVEPSASLVHELEMEPFGRLDFLVREGRRWYAIEVKINEAKHDVVGQIDKYILSLSLDMCMGLHDEVKAAVLAGSFSPYAASELSRMGVTMLTHDGTVEGIRKLAKE